MPLTTTIFLLLHLCLIPVSAAGCFFPDGSAAPVADTPCNDQAVTSRGVSACCNSNAWCLDNGLCFRAGTLSRGSCTDRTWSSSRCPHYCTAESPSWGVDLLKTPSGFKCYGTTNTDFKVPNGTDIMLRPAQVEAIFGLDSSGPLRISLNSMSRTDGAQGPSTSTDPSNSGRSDNATDSCGLDGTDRDRQYSITILAGSIAAVGVPLLIITALLLTLLLREKKLTKQLKSQPPSQAAQMASQHATPAMQSSHFDSPPSPYPSDQYRASMQHARPYYWTSSPPAFDTIKHNNDPRLAQEVEGNSQIVELDENRNTATK